MSDQRNSNNIWQVQKTPRTNDITSETFNVSAFVRELIIHIILLISITIIAVFTITPTMFHMTTSLTYRFVERTDVVSFHHLSTTQEFWIYVLEVLPDLLFKSHRFNNESSKVENQVLLQNTLLGTARLRQLRVRNDSCNIAKDFQLVVFECTGRYKNSHEFKGTFGPGLGSAWVYGSQRTFYNNLPNGGGGFSIYLTPSYEKATKEIAYLKDNFWIGQETRAVFVEFTVYNPSVNLVCIIKLICEFSASGGVKTSWHFRTGDVRSYESPHEKVLLGFEIIFCFLVLYYTFLEVAEVYSKRLDYFKDARNLFDFILLALCIAGIGLGIYRFLTMRELLRLYHERSTTYTNFETFAYWQEHFQIICGAASFFVWMKLFQFASFSSISIQLTKTMTRCAKSLSCFAVMFLVVFVSFAQLGFLLFGSKLIAFQNIVSAMSTLMNMLVGEANFESLREGHRFIGPVYYFAYIIFVIFILTQMFLAIIADTYSKVVTEYYTEHHHPNPFLTFLQDIIDRVPRRPSEQVPQLEVPDDRLTLTGMIRVLKDRDFTNAEIGGFLAKNFIHDQSRFPMEEFEEKMNQWGSLRVQELGERGETAEGAQPLGEVIQDLLERVRRVKKELEEMNEELG